MIKKEFAEICCACNKIKAKHDVMPSQIDCKCVFCGEERMRIMEMNEELPENGDCELTVSIMNKRSGVVRIGGTIVKANEIKQIMRLELLSRLAKTLVHSVNEEGFKELLDRK